MQPLAVSAVPAPSAGPPGAADACSRAHNRGEAYRKQLKAKLRSAVPRSLRKQAFRLAELEEPFVQLDSQKLKELEKLERWLTDQFPDEMVHDKVDIPRERLMRRLREEENARGLPAVPSAPRPRPASASAGSGAGGGGSGRGGRPSGLARLSTAAELASNVEAKKLELVAAGAASSKKRAAVAAAAPTLAGAKRRKSTPSVLGAVAVVSVERGGASGGGGGAASSHAVVQNGAAYAPRAAAVLAPPQGHHPLLHAPRGDVMDGAFLLADAAEGKGTWAMRGWGASALPDSHAAAEGGRAGGVPTLSQASLDLAPEPAPYFSFSQGVVFTPGNPHGAGHVEPSIASWDVVSQLLRSGSALGLPAAGSTGSSASETFADDIALRSEASLQDVYRASCGESPPPTANAVSSAECGVDAVLRCVALRCCTEHHPP
jgi:hypothetical protein